jgi:hypothetical protein
MVRKGSTVRVRARALRKPRSEAGVGQDGDERRVELAIGVEQIGADPFDRLWRERPDDPGPGLAGLADVADGVAVDPPPLDRALENGLQHRQSFENRVVTDAVGGHLGA